MSMFVLAPMRLHVPEKSDTTFLLERKQAASLNSALHCFQNPKEYDGRSHRFCGGGAACRDHQR